MESNDIRLAPLERHRLSTDVPSLLSKVSKFKPGKAEIEEINEANQSDLLLSPSTEVSDTICPDEQWDGSAPTTWQHEAKFLVRSSATLIPTFVLQYSLTVTSIFVAGHIGKTELAAVSLASMTAKITGYSVYQGLATSLDTLCAQAYGSGRKELVGLQLQRMVCFLMLVTVPIGIVWFNGAVILKAIVPDKETASLAGLYLRVIILGAPGYATFESGKRFVQAQGLFNAPLYVLLVGAPLNVFLNWLFVWYFNWGFIGAPIAVTVTDNLLPFFLFLYVYYGEGRECWGGFSRAALRSWMPMLKLALPGLIMTTAEFFAFEILTLAASYLSTVHLAAQSILYAIGVLAFHLQFPIGIAASTRIGNLIGASLPRSARTATLVALAAATLVGLFNQFTLLVLRSRLPLLFTADAEVARLAEAVMPVCVALQLIDALATMCSAILRGLGRQAVGGYVNLFAFYAVAMPVSFATCFGLGWGLTGLWSGMLAALSLVAGIEGFLVFRINWQETVEEARERNTMG